MKKYICFTLGMGCLLAMTACGAKEGEGKRMEVDAVQGMSAKEDGQPLDVADSGADGEDMIAVSEAPDGADMAAGADAGQGTSEGTDGTAYIVDLRIVDGAESGNLVLAGEGSGQVYTLSLNTASSAGGAEGSGSHPAPAVFLDGQPADYAALEDGMMVRISYDGTVEETFPARFGGVESVSAYSLGTEQNPGGSLYDLCGLYLQVLNDLWEKDRGLNDGISCVSVDLSQAPGGLTKGEWDAVAWIFGCEHEVESLTMTYEELKEQGYLTEVMEEIYQWEDGVLFRITPGQGEEMDCLGSIKFDAEKWCSPKGAYFLMDCTAAWPETGTWSSYEIGSEAIS